MRALCRGPARRRGTQDRDRASRIPVLERRRPRAASRSRAESFEGWISRGTNRWSLFRPTTWSAPTPYASS